MKHYLKRQGYHFVRSVKISDLRYNDLFAECRLQHPEESPVESHARVLYRHIGMTRNNRAHRLGWTLLRALAVVSLLAAVLLVGSKAHGQTNVNIDRVGGTTVNSPLPVTGTITNVPHVICDSGCSGSGGGGGASAITLINAQAATGSVTGAAVTIPGVSAVGTLYFTFASITGSPSGCTVQPINYDSLGNAVNNGSAISVSPANGTTAVSLSPNSNLVTASQISATYSCSGYPATGTVSVSYAPATATDRKVSGPDSAGVAPTQGPVVEGGYDGSFIRAFKTDSAGVLQINQTGGSVTINTTSPLTGGGTVAFGGAITLQCPTCVTTSLSNPMTTLGDIIYGAGGGTPTRLSIGGANTLLHGGTTPLYSAVGQNDVTGGYVDLSTTQASIAGAKTFTGANTECSVNGVFYIGGNCASTWGNGDIGAQANTVYAGVCAVQGGCTISVIPQSNGVCYPYTTPIVFATIGEQVLLTSTNANGITTGNVPGGGCISFTTTAGTSASSGTGAEATNTVTLTFAAVPSGLAVNNIVNVTGCSVAGYNGFYRVLTVTSTTFTYTDPTAGLGAATTCTATIAPEAVKLDWTPAAGGGYETGSGITNLLITNGTTYTAGGSGSSAIAVRVGNTNSGAHNATFANFKHAGFGVGFFSDNTISWGNVFDNVSCAYSTNCYVLMSGIENTTLKGGKMASVGTGIIAAGGDMTMSFMSCDNPSTTCINFVGTSGSISLHSNHFETGSGGNGAGNGAACIFICGNPVVTFDGDVFVDDYVSGNATSFFAIGGNSIQGSMRITTAGQTVTELFNLSANVTGDLSIFNQSPTVITTYGNGGAQFNAIEWHINVPNGSTFLPVQLPQGLKFPQTTCPAFAAGFAYLCSVSSTEFDIVAATGAAGGVVTYDSGGTNAITDTVNGSITSYTNNRPLAAASGVQFSTNAASTIQQNFSGDSAHSLSQLAKTAAVTTFTLCAATANTACGQAGQYRISYNFYGSGTACATVTAGSVGLNLTWTDTNAVTHTTIPLPLWDQKSAAMTNGVFNFNTALTTESASGSFIISTNGTIIQAATTYTACTSGTGTYNLKMTVEQLQ